MCLSLYGHTYLQSAHTETQEQKKALQIQVRTSFPKSKVYSTNLPADQRFPLTYLLSALPLGLTSNALAYLHTWRDEGA